MIINHTHGFVFIHIPKAAGTSVTKSLSTLTRYCDLELGGTGMGEAAQGYYSRRFGLRKHSRASEVRKVIGEERFDAFFTFSFVRNPFNRLASAYHFLRSWTGVPADFANELVKYPDFESFLESDLWTSSFPTRGPDAIFQPQARWLYSQDANPRMLVDYVGKTETLDQDMEKILLRIGAGSIPVTETANKSLPYSLPKIWRPAIVDKILHEYRRDFHLFGYPPDPPTNGE